MKKVLIISLLAIFLSCEQLHEGNVIDKKYIPERYYTSTSFIMSGKTMIPIITDEYDEPEFIIIIEGNVNNSLKTREFRVSESLYNQINIGDFVKDN